MFIVTDLVSLRYGNHFYHIRHVRILRNGSYDIGIGPLDKSAWLKVNFLISKPKLMLWVLQRTESAPKICVNTYV